MARDQIERLLDRRLEEFERRFQEFARRYCTEKEVLALCNKVTAQRWRNVNFPVSSDADNPGPAEDDAKAMMAHLKDMTENAADRKGRFGRTLTQIAAILGGVGSFFGLLWTVYTIMAHLK